MKAWHAVLLLVVAAGAVVLALNSSPGPVGGPEPTPAPAPDEDSDELPPPMGLTPVELGEPLELPEGAIGGRVLDAEGEPLEGVRLSLAPAAEETRSDQPVFTPGEGGENPFLARFRQRGRAAGRWESSSDSGEDGFFHVAPGGAGPFQLTARLAGYGTEVVEPIPEGAKPLLVVLHPAARVGGRIVSAVDGSPLFRAEVSVGSERGWSDAKGRYMVFSLPPGETVLTVRAGGFAAQIRRVTLSPGETLQEIDFELGEGPGIVGVVVSPDGEPVGGAAVSLIAVFGTRESTTTDDRGRFGFSDLAAGTYTLTAQHDDYGPVRRPDVQLEEGQRRDGVELRLGVAGDLEGVVREEGGGAVEGATVTAILADDPGMEPFEKTARTDAAGAFSISGLGVGAWEVTARQAGFVPADVQRVVVAPGVAAQADFTLSRGHSISGRVVNRDGRPVGGARVETAAGNPMMAFRPGAGEGTTADAEGYFEFTGLREESLDLVASASGYADSEKTRASAGEDGLLLVLRAPSGITGRVTDRGGQPVQGYEIEAMPASSAFPGVPGFEAEGVAVLHDDGTYTITGLPPGAYTVGVFAEGLAPENRPGVEVEEGQTTEGVDFELGPGMVLEGRVVAEADNRPVVGAKVEVSIAANAMLNVVGMGRKMEGESDAEGSFSISGLPEGTVPVKVTHSDYAPLSIPSVNLPLSEPLTVRLPGGGTVVVTALSADGQAQVEAMVILQRNFPWQQFMGVTDSAGQVRFERIPAGAWMAMRMNAGQIARRGLSGMDFKFEMATARNGETTEVVLKEEPGVEVTGQVLRGGQGLSGAMVYLTSGEEGGAALSDMKFGMTEAEGAFTIPNVRPGDYTLSVTQPGTFMPAHSQPVTVGPSGASGVRVEIPPAEVSGRLLDEAGEGVPGVQVILVPEEMADFRSGSMDDAMSTVGGMTTSDTDGAFTFEGLRPGRYVVRAWREGLAGVFSDPFEVPLLGNGPTDLMVTLPVGGEVTIRVRGPDGEAVGGAWVFATDDRGRAVPLSMYQAAQTGSDGVVKARLAAGRYRLEVQPAELPAVTTEVSVSGRGGEEVGVTIPRGGSIAVMVVDGDEAPLAGLTVQLLDAAGLPAGRRMTADFLGEGGSPTRTGEDGKIVFEQVAPGTYTVTVADDGGRSAARAVTVTAGAEAETTLTLE